MKIACAGANRSTGMVMGLGHDLHADCVHGTMRKKTRADALNHRSVSIMRTHAVPKLLKT